MSPFYAKSHESDTSSLPQRQDLRDHIQTVADGCEHGNHVTPTELYPENPSDKREPIATHSGRTLSSEKEQGLGFDNCKLCCHTRRPSPARKATCLMIKTFLPEQTIYSSVVHNFVDVHCGLSRLPAVYKETATTLPSPP